ncbi:hypothetical protein EWM64_g10502 [Hericium alpestre]|uniref:Uncharacterized protein n=1 Tax=Hericium alpestre TaxID=135208 RepID=A0A4Y9ZH61_9AGAM|nr:hypothetical protein EWM64_g10502 [Hericium alpestre]
MSAGALQPAIDALYQDKHTVVVTESRWFKTLRDSVRYADAHPNLEHYFYGPLTQILSTYAETCGDGDSEATLFTQSPDLIFTVLKDTLNVENTGYGKVMLPGWLEAKPPKEESDVDATGVPFDDTSIAHRLSVRLSRDLVQLCKQAYFAFHHFPEDIVHAIITYGMKFFCFRFIRPANWNRIQGDENGSVGSPEPSWFQLPPDYSDPAPDLHVAKKALKLYEAPEPIPGPSPEQQEKKQDGNDSYVLSSANSTDTAGLQLTGPTPSRKPSQRGRTRHASPDDSPSLNHGKLKSKRRTGRTRQATRAASPAEDLGPNSDHRDGYRYITLHIPVRSRTNAGMLAGPDRIIKRMRNREGVLPPADKDSEAAADGAQKDKPGAHKSRKRGRSDDADGANDNGQIQRKTGREKRPRLAQKPVADNRHASTSRTQDEGPAAVITLGHADTGHAEPATVPSEDAQESVEPSTSHAVTDTRSATQQGEEVAGRGGVVLRRSTRYKKAR